MLCETCQKRDATVHFTTISGDVLKKVDLCDECFRASNLPHAHELTEAQEAGCRYCGGKAHCGGADPIAGLGGVKKISFMCRPCAEEYFRFLDLKMPGFGSDTLTKEQAAKLAKHDSGAIFTLAEEHMKKWVAERDSQ